MRPHAPTGTLQIVEQFSRPTSYSIPAIVRGYKSTVTKQIHELDRNFTEPIWQKNYFESMIRNEEQLENVREYIRNNPKNWANDELNYYR